MVQKITDHRALLEIRGTDVPRRKRVSRRRASVADGWIIWANDGDIPHDTPENAVAREEWLTWEYFSNDQEIAEMFRLHGDRAIAAWEIDHPGTRSERWLRYAAPDQLRERRNMNIY